MQIQITQLSPSTTHNPQQTGTVSTMEGSQPPLTAQQTADWFLAWAEHVDADISNLKLQKLLYYAQGHYLGRFKKPLFSDPIEAWAHGPVIPHIYRSYKQYGKAPINTFKAIPSDFDWDNFTPISDYLMDVWNKYGHLAAWTLREKTHTETPWRDAFNRGLNQVIGQEAMTAFFAA
jgi:uncharacterized phage-associated protein